ncbi:hypothetical protein ABH931_002596 [Streptacidiphilus sp. MAP12-33]|uniref:hypothetical protein n=1 Tax=Streptacidiphilus sp. MAP12-33 TaxID=3156266 RepID=UPI003517FCE6
MDRATILANLASDGAELSCEEISALAAELDLLTADLLVVAGRPVPEEFLPPQRDAKITRHFAYRVSHCSHATLSTLEGFIRALPRVPTTDVFVPSVPPQRPLATTGLGAVFNGLIRNRGFDIRDLPFLGLSRSTLKGMSARWEPSRHRQFQLCAVAGPLGWTLPDLFAVAGEPYSDELRPVMHCRHLGRVLTAAIPLTTDQLVQAGRHADRLNPPTNRGAWRPVAEGFVAQCPDYP